MVISYKTSRFLGFPDLVIQGPFVLTMNQFFLGPLQPLQGLHDLFPLFPEHAEPYSEFSVWRHMSSDWLDVSKRNISPTYKCFSGELALGFLFSHVLFLRAKPDVLGTVEVSTVVPNFTSTPSMTSIISGAGNCLTLLGDTSLSSNTLARCTVPGAHGSVGLWLLQDDFPTSRLPGQTLEIPVFREVIALRTRCD